MRTKHTPGPWFVGEVNRKKQRADINTDTRDSRLGYTSWTGLARVDADKLIEWIEWSGGECPVSGDSWVEIRCRNMASTIGEAGGFSWDHMACSGYDIIAYRIYTGLQ